MFTVDIDNHLWQRAVLPVGYEKKTWNLPCGVCWKATLCARGKKIKLMIKWCKSRGIWGIDINVLRLSIKVHFKGREPGRENYWEAVRKLEGGLGSIPF